MLGRARTGNRRPRLSVLPAIDQPSAMLKDESLHTKTYLNAVTIQYAKKLSDTNVLINNACPGYVATDLNAFNGTQTPEQGAAIAIRLATLPDDGPSGGLFDDTGIVPW